MAKNAAKKNILKKAVAAKLGDAQVIDGGMVAAATRCDAGGDEIQVFKVPALVGQNVRFTLTICKANARARVWMRALPDGTERLLVDDAGKDAVSVLLSPGVPRGEHFVRWSIVTPSPDWQTKTEVDVEGTTAFRWRKKATGNNPLKGGTLVLVLS